MGDYKPAGNWYNIHGPWAEDQYACILMEADGNHYLQLGGGQRDKGGLEIYYNMPIRAYNNNLHLRGNRCVFQFDYVGNKYSKYAYIGSDAPPEMYSQGKTIGDTRGTWRRDYSMYYTNPPAANGNSFVFGIASADDIGKVDNISLELVENEKLTISETDSEVTAKFAAFGTDYSAPEKYRTATLILARYRVCEGNVLTLDGVIEMDSDTAEMVAIVSSRYYGDNPDEVGETPLRASATIAKPANNGEYIYKAFAWDRIGPMRSQVAAKTLS